MPTKASAASGSGPAPELEDLDAGWDTPRKSTATTARKDAADALDEGWEAAGDPSSTDQVDGGWDDLAATAPPAAARARVALAPTPAAPARVAAAPTPAAPVRAPASTPSAPARIAAAPTPSAPARAAAAASAPAVSYKHLTLATKRIV